MLIFVLLPKASPTPKPLHQDQKKKNVVSTAPAAKPATLASAQPAPATAPAAVAPAPITYAIGCQNYLPLVQQYPWSVSTAMAIMQAESGCNPNAVSNATINWNHVPDYGLFQLNGVDILNPADNVAYAYYHKYVPSGWTPWTTYTSGLYLRYLQ